MAGSREQYLNIHWVMQYFLRPGGKDIQGIVLNNFLLYPEFEKKYFPKVIDTQWLPSLCAFEV